MVDERPKNITTRGIDLLALPTGTELHIGPCAKVLLTGLRNPCIQLNHFQAGLMSAVLDRAVDGAIVRKVGVMGVVLTGGVICAGDTIIVTLPAAPHVALDRV